MTESPAIDHLTHTVFFGRKKGLPNYSNEEASFFLQFDTELGATAEQIIDAARSKMVVVKSVVLEQLGIEFELDDDGVIVEKGAAAPAPKQPDAVTTLREAFPGAVAEPQAPTQTYSPASADVDPKTLGKYEQKAWLQKRVRSHPHEFFDNRADKASGKGNPKSPDWKHKSSGLGLWAA